MTKVGGAGNLDVSASTYDIDFGKVLLGQSFYSSLSLVNSALGQADLLSGSSDLAGFAGDFGLTGFTDFSGLAAGGRRADDRGSRDGAARHIPAAAGVRPGLRRWARLQTWQLASERTQLQELRASQEAPGQQAVKVRASADALASATAALAAQGNATARPLVGELGRRGISLRVVDKAPGGQK